MYFRNGPKAAVDIAEKRINFASPIGQAQVLPRRLRRGKSELVRNPLMFRAVSDQHMCDPTDGPQGDHLPPITKKAGPMSFHPEKKSAEVMTLRTEGLAPSYFSHALKASTGSAPYQWQLQARIQRAQALLLFASKSLDDVAEATGFADAAHFTRMFRKLTGHAVCMA